MTERPRYTKYVEMSDAWRQERSDKKKIQGYLDAILDELERKAPLINEQKAEYERLMDSHDALAKRLEDAINERGVLESAITKARSDAQRSAREKRSMEGQAEDLSRQVQVLLKEVEDMKAGRAVLGGSQPIQAMQSGATPTTASDVITDHLVEFKSIKDLQEQNKRLLAVARQLGEDNEQKISDVRKTLQEVSSLAEAFAPPLHGISTDSLSELFRSGTLHLQQDHSKEVESIKAQVASLAQQKQQQEELVNQVLRQRDLYKSLLSEKEGANAAGGGSPAFGNSNSGGADIAVAQDHKQMYLDLQKDYDKFKFENGENLRMLRDEVYKYREEAGVARGEKTQLQAQISFERERHERLSEVCASHAKEIESLVQRNAGLISKLTQHEQRLKDLSFDQDVTKDDLRREKERNVSLRAERDLLEKSEKRLSGEMAAAVAEKHRHQASVESLIQRYGEQEKAWAKERERILAENQKMQESWAEAQKRLLEESTRSRDALSASSNLAADTAARIATLEVELKTTAKAKDEAEQKVSAALANVENLQGSLQKAEEKAALAVMRSTTMAQEASQDQAQAQTTGTESDVISKLKAQLKSAQNDAGSAQEAAAAAAGHLAQYKAMCAASDQALAAMKEAHEGFKAQAQATADAAQADLEAARAALTKAEEEVAQKRSVDAEEEKKRLAQEEVLISENAKLREEAARLQKQLELTGEKVAALQTDIKDYHQQWRNAKSMYDNELIAHAADVKRLGAAQEEADRVKQEVSSVKAERDDAKAGAAQMQSEKASLAAKVEEIKRQNHILHEELEAATLKAVASMEQRMDLAASGAGQSSESTEIQQVVQYLRKEKETIDCQLSLVQQENVRLRKQVEYALQRADAADQRLEQSRKQKMDEDDHEKALKDIESLNLLRESNAGLRDENGKLQTRLRDLTKAKADSEAALTPLKEQVARMQALLDSKEDEVKSIKDQSSRWEARTQNLLDKYGQVDLGEYQRVVRALAEAEKGKEKVEERVAGAVKAAMEARTKELADTKTALEKAKAQEQIAKKQIFNIFNPTRLSIPQWIQERDAARKKAEDMEQAMAASKEKEREGEDAFKAREKELRAEAEEAKAAKNDLQLKVLEKLKRAKETRLTLVQKVKSLEKQLKGKQSGSGQEGEAKPATAKAKKSAQKKRERESPLKTKETPKKKAKKPQEEQEPSPAATQASPEVADPPPSAEPTPMAADEAATHPEAPQDAPAEAEAAPEAAAAGSGAEADAEATTDAEEAAPDAAEEADVEAREEEEPAKEEAEEAPPKEEEEAAPAKDEGGEGHHQTESEADAPEKQDPPELNPMASPFTPSKAAMAAALGAEEAGQEEVEEGGDPEDEEVVDPAYEDEVTDQGETEIEEDAPENEADTAAEDQVLADQDDAAEAEPKAASKPKPISWKGGKKSAGKKAAAAAAAASPVVSKEAVKQAKKSAAAATRGGKSGIRKKIAKKKKQGTEGGKKT